MTKAQCAIATFQFDTSRMDEVARVFTAAPGVFDVECAPDGEVRVYLYPDDAKIGAFTDWIEGFMQVGRLRDAAGKQ